MPSVWLDKMLDARGVANVGPIMDGKPLDDPADTAASRTRLGPGKLTSRGSAQNKSGTTVIVQPWATHHVFTPSRVVLALNGV